MVQLYRKVLNRPPDLAGLFFWTDQLNRGLSRATLARGFLRTPDGVREQIRRTYADLLDRTPTAAEAHDDRRIRSPDATWTAATWTSPSSRSGRP